MENDDCTPAHCPPTPDRVKLPKSLSAAQLRWIAERASSARSLPTGEVWYAVLEGGDVHLERRPRNDPPSEFLFKIDTEVVEHRSRPESLCLKFRERTLELARCYDAVFWSEAAVEKFVLPYYASRDLWGAADVLKQISLVWYGRVPPPEPGPFPQPNPAMVPIAIAHLPDSEWTPIPEDVAQGLQVIMMQGDRLIAVPLSEALGGRNGEPPGAATDPAPQTPAGLGGV